MAKAQSGLVEDLLKLGKALRELEEAFVKFVDAKGLGQIGDDDVKKAEKEIVAAEINRYKAEVQHERTHVRFPAPVRLVGGRQRPQEAGIDRGRQEEELWKGFGIEL